MKHALVDIAVTILILLAVATEWEWARWILLIYTPVMLLLKIAAVTAAGSMRTLNTPASTPPKALLHILYAVDVLVLGFAGWWYLFAGWIGIWVLSAIQGRRTV